MKMFLSISAALLFLIAGLPPRAQAADTGPDLYKAKCAMCHGADGSGNTPMGKRLQLRDLGSADVQKQSDSELTAIIDKGKGKMPSFGGKLSQPQINDLVKYIRSLKK